MSREGSVFTGVCLSTEGRSVSQHAIGQGGMYSTGMRSCLLNFFIQASLNQQLIQKFSWGQQEI